ncbi:uncharacterized protein K02A2.6-like [Ixodes scapularis]|uniref:uncharacterized protein K02A2.6-like n=1 Tax=Ixodes scapularis TaxID=6945 RepID=UPI001A9F951E|nr:uncharacterized protein K02A2.6-like [Ixodes scapularis]
MALRCNTSLETITLLTISPDTLLRYQKKISNARLKSLFASPWKQPGLTLSFDEVRASADRLYTAIAEAIDNNTWHRLTKEFPSTRDTEEINKLTKVREQLSTQTNIILQGTRILIPRPLCIRAVQLAHVGHQGMVKTKQLLRTKVWFPKMDSLCTETIQACVPCQACDERSHQEPLSMTKLPERPWAEIAIDLHDPLQSGKYLLVIIDEQSRFPVLEVVRSTSAKQILPRLRKTFALFGTPDVVKSDNGPPFNGKDVASFAAELNFHHRKVTPYWPQANGTVERFMRPLVKLIQTAHIEAKDLEMELDAYLASYRQTPPLTTGCTPYGMMFGRVAKGLLPTVTPPECQQTETQDHQKKKNIKAYADQRRRAHHREFSVGEGVIKKRETRRKHQSVYDPEQLTVIATKGNTIIAASKERKKSLPKQDVLQEAANAQLRWRARISPRDDDDDAQAGNFTVVKSSTSAADKAEKTRGTVLASCRLPPNRERCSV